MAGPGGREVARVSVRVLPDTSSFAASLQAYLERMEQRLRLNLPVSLDQGDVLRTEAQLAALARDRTVNLDIDTETLSRNLGNVARAGRGNFGFLSPGVIGAVTVAVAALGAALPGVLASIAIPIAAIAAGFDGIKKAAEVLAKPFEHLQKVVSATFEQGLAPAMKDLANLFPTLERGLNAVARPLVEMFTELVGALSFSAATGQLDRIFQNIGDALHALAPAVGPFISSLLLLAESGTRAFAQFAPLLTKITQGFNNLLASLAVTGDLDGAMRAIGATFIFVAAVIAALIGSTILLFAAFARVAQFVRQLPGIFTAAWSAITTSTTAAWNRVRTVITTAVNGVRSRVAAAWSAVRSVTSSAWSGIQSVVSGAVSRITSVIRGIPGRVRSGLSSLGSIGRNAANAFKTGILSVLDGVVAKVQAAVDKIVSAFKKALKVSSPSRVMMQIGQWTGEGFQIGLEDAFAGVEKAAMALANAPITATSAAKFLPPDTDASQPDLMKVYVVNANEVAAGVVGVAEGVVSNERAFAGTMGRMG